jgi:hypothetical protein
MKYRYSDEPHPHIFIDELVSPQDYQKMKFPDELIAPEDKWGITSGDERYQEVMADPLWSSLRDELTGEPFVRSVLTEFSSAMRSSNCLVDPERFNLVDFVESREEKEAPVLQEQGDPNEVFTRLDFQSKGETQYREFVHLDWPRRIIGGILFFSDQQEEGLKGGELALFRDRAFANDRWCHDPQLTVQFPPRHNTGIIFLNSNTGFHGPRGIRKCDGRRRWLYYTISSKVDVWPAEPPPA